MIKRSEKSTKVEDKVNAKELINRSIYMQSKLSRAQSSSQHFVDNLLENILEQERSGVKLGLNLRVEESTCKSTIEKKNLDPLQIQDNNIDQSHFISQITKNNLVFEGKDEVIKGKKRIYYDLENSALKLIKADYTNNEYYFYVDACNALGTPVHPIAMLTTLVRCRKMENDALTEKLLKSIEKVELLEVKGRSYATKEYINLYEDIKLLNEQKQQIELLIKELTDSKSELHEDMLKKLDIYIDNLIDIAKLIDNFLIKNRVCPKQCNLKDNAKLLKKEQEMRQNVFLMLSRHKELEALYSKYFVYDEKIITLENRFIPKQEYIDNALDLLMIDINKYIEEQELTLNIHSSTSDTSSHSFTDRFSHSFTSDTFSEKCANKTRSVYQSIKNKINNSSLMQKLRVQDLTQRILEWLLISTFAVFKVELKLNEPIIDVNKPIINIEELKNKIQLPLLDINRSVQIYNKYNKSVNKIIMEHKALIEQLKQEKLDIKHKFTNAQLIFFGITDEEIKCRNEIIDQSILNILNSIENDIKSILDNDKDLDLFRMRENISQLENILIYIKNKHLQAFNQNILNTKLQKDYKTEIEAINLLILNKEREIQNNQTSVYLSNIRSFVLNNTVQNIFKDTQNSYGQAITFKAIERGISSQQIKDTSKVAEDQFVLDVDTKCLSKLEQYDIYTHSNIENMYTDILNNNDIKHIVKIKLTSSNNDTAYDLIRFLNLLSHPKFNMIPYETFISPQLLESISSFVTKESVSKLFFSNNNDNNKVMILSMLTLSYLMYSMYVHTIDAIDELKPSYKFSLLKVFKEKRDRVNITVNKILKDLFNNKTLELDNDFSTLIEQLNSFHDITSSEPYLGSIEILLPYFTTKFLHSKAFNEANVYDKSAMALVHLIHDSIQHISRRRSIVIPDSLANYALQEEKKKLNFHKNFSDLASIYELIKRSIGKKITDLSILDIQKEGAAYPDISIEQDKDELPSHIKNKFISDTHEMFRIGTIDSQTIDDSEIYRLYNMQSTTGIRMLLFAMKNYTKYIVNPYYSVSPSGKKYGYNAIELDTIILPIDKIRLLFNRNNLNTLQTMYKFLNFDHLTHDKLEYLKDLYQYIDKDVYKNRELHVEKTGENMSFITVNPFHARMTVLNKPHNKKDKEVNIEQNIKNLSILNSGKVDIDLDEIKNIQMDIDSVQDQEEKDRLHASLLDILRPNIALYQESVLKLQRIFSFKTKYVTSNINKKELSKIFPPLDEDVLGPLNSFINDYFIDELQYIYNLKYDTKYQYNMLLNEHSYNKIKASEVQNSIKTTINSKKEIHNYKLLDHNFLTLIRLNNLKISDDIKQKITNLIREKDQIEKEQQKRNVNYLYVNNVAFYTGGSFVDQYLPLYVYDDVSKDVLTLCNLIEDLSILEEANQSTKYDTSGNKLIEDNKVCSILLDHHVGETIMHSLNASMLLQNKDMTIISVPETELDVMKGKYSFTPYTNHNLRIAKYSFTDIADIINNLLLLDNSLWFASGLRDCIPTQLYDVIYEAFGNNASNKVSIYDRHNVCSLIIALGLGMGNNAAALVALKQKYISLKESKHISSMPITYKLLQVMFETEKFEYKDEFTKLFFNTSEITNQTLYYNELDPFYFSTIKSEKMPSSIKLLTMPIYTNIPLLNIQTMTVDIALKDRKNVTYSVNSNTFPSEKRFS